MLNKMEDMSLLMGFLLSLIMSKCSALLVEETHLIPVSIV